MQLTIEELKILCQNFDKEYGMWPEDKYQGKSVYEFILSSLNIEYDSSHWDEIIIMKEGGID